MHECMRRHPLIVRRPVLAKLRSLFVANIVENDAMYFLGEKVHHHHHHHHYYSHKLSTPLPVSPGGATLVTHIVL